MHRKIHKSKPDARASLYDVLILKQKKRRALFYARFQEGPIWNNDLIREHMESTRTKITPPNVKEKQLLMIVKDLLIFPELYLDVSPKILAELYSTMDENPHFSAFFTSSGRHIMKSHGSVAIGCDILRTGVAVSGTGDPTRIKMTLPKSFVHDLIGLLEGESCSLTAEVKGRFGNKMIIIKTLKSTLYFDSKALSILLEGMLPKQKNNDIVKNFIKEFNRIVFTYCRFDQKQTYAIHQEIWTKPRSSQQLTDTQKFNSIFSIYLEDLKKSALARLGGYFYHPISRRVAIRKQPNVKVSTLLKNYISFEHDKKRRDDKRSLSYRFNIKNIWRFGGTFDFINDRVSSCVGFATRLLGSTPIVASFANLFSRTGLMIQTDEEKAQEDKGIRNFIKTSFNHLHFGHAKEKGNVRKQDLKKLTHYAEGCGVIYDPTLKKSFAIGFGAMREHIWSCVVTDGNGILLPRNQWKPGWVCADKVSASSMSSEMVVKMLDLQENKEDLTDPRHKDAEHVTLKHPYDPKKYAVPKRPDPGSIAYLALAFKNNQSFMLGSHLAELRDGKIYWNGHEFDSKDYKGHPILIPNAKMYDWLEQRRILKINVDRYPNKIKETVIFGTASDHYPLYPDLLGFMARRNISKKTNTWIQKKEKYADRQGRLNPDRAHLLGQQSFFMPPGYHPSFLQNRSDEICEKCGLQIKHAPRKIMLNRFVRTHDDFIYAYLSGSQGVPKGTLLESDDIHRPRPAHITDHELYRAFGGKHRDEILGHLHFADVDLVFDAPSKANQICYHPLRLLYHRQFGLKNDEAYVSPLNLD